MKTLKLIVNYLRIPKITLAILFFSSVAVALFESLGVSLLFPILRFVEVGSDVFQQGSMSFVWKIFLQIINFLHLPFNLLSLLLVCFVPILLKQAFIYINLAFIAKAQFDATARLQSQCFNSLLRTDLDFISKNKLGVFVSTLTLEVVRAGQTVSFFFKLVSSTFLLATYSVIIFYLSTRLSFLMILTSVVIQFLIHRHMVQSTIWGGKVSSGNDEFGHAINIKLSAMRLIKLHNTQEQESQLLTKIVNSVAKDQVTLREKNALIQVTIEPILIFGCFVTLYIGVTLFGMNFASMGLFLFVLMRMLPLVKEVNSLRQELRSYIPSFQNVANVVNGARENVKIVSGDVPFDGLKKGIIFKDVDFSYDERKTVLSDLTLTIPAGKTTAIVGQSGAGKSTIVDLIVRLRDVQRGEIFVDDTPLRQIDLTSFRRAVGFVSQEAFLLNDTIFNNVAYGLSDVSPSDVEKVLKMSHLWEFVQRLPDGVETIVGDRGASLSGGERQRLCMARALLRKPSLLILDEPTSALDAQSEKFIQQTIDEIHNQMTIIIIAHRFSTIKNADGIVVLDGGAKMATGSHEELMKNNSYYSQMFGLQLQ